MNPARRRISLSLAAVLLLWGALAIRLVSRPPLNPICWDAFGYHLYLPATLIHGDPGIHDAAWVREAMDTYQSSGTLYQISELPDGRWVNKYTMGLAILWSPFFVVGHVVAGLVGEPQDGFSAPYQWALLVALLVYVLAGLLLVRRVLSDFFSEGVTIAVLVAIVLGTNYLNQTLHSAGVPHIFLFTLAAGVLWHSIKWHREGKRRDALVLGVLLGLLTIARPSEVVWVLVPLLIGMRDANSWKQHLRALWSKRGRLLLMAMVAVLVCLPQSIYWKWMTGKWFYMSYNNPGEGFEFLHPNTWEVLFSFRKGWYIYTPLMLVATMGILLLRRSLPELRWPVIFFLLLNLYVVSSWSCWWYADSFGQRALVQSYALMALPLGAVVQWLGTKRLLARSAGAVLVFGLVGFNLFQFHQCEEGLIHTSRMTRSAYAAVFGALAVPADLGSLLSVERSYSDENGAPDLTRYRRTSLVQLSFDGIPFHEQGRWQIGATLDKDRSFSPAWSSAWAAVTPFDHAWFHVSCTAQRPADGSAPALSLVTTFEHKGQSYAYKVSGLQWDATAPGEWTTVRAWYLSPEVRRPDDVFKAYCWLRDTLPVVVGEMTVELYEPRSHP